MVAIDITNTIKALELNLADNEEFYINGDITEERYVYMRNQIEMQLNYYLSLFGDDNDDV